MLHTQQLSLLNYIAVLITITFSATFKALLQHMIDYYSRINRGILWYSLFDSVCECCHEELVQLLPF